MRRETRNSKLARMPNADAFDERLTPTINVSAIPDGDAPEWLDVPYLDVPYDRDGIVGVQRLNLPIAQRLADNMARAMRVEPRLAGGLPIYERGHPDYIDRGDAAAVRKWLQNQPPAVGWIREFAAGPESLRVRVEWNEDGRALLARRRYKNWSPFFRSEPTVIEMVNNVRTQIYEPRFIQSAGLTNTPNWPMPPMVNAALSVGGEGTEGSMDLLQRLIALIGDAAIKTDDDAVNAVANLISAVRKLKESVDARWKSEDAARMALPNAGDPFALAEGFIAHLEGSLLAAQANAGARVAAQTLAETLNAQLTAVRAEFAAHVVNAAVARGAVLQEHAASRIQDMVNAGDAFAAKAKEIDALPKLMKTESAAGDVASRSKAAADRRTKILEMVNAELPKHGNNYDAAFASVQAQHPDLFQDAAPQK